MLQKRASYFEDSSKCSCTEDVAAPMLWLICVDHNLVEENDRGKIMRASEMLSVYIQVATTFKKLPRTA